MNNCRSKNAKRNAVWAVGNKMIQTLLPFAVRTVLIYTMGAQYVGINSLFTSILKILSLAELGFSNAITYNMYKPIANNELDKVCALLNLYKKIYQIVGLIILGIGISLMPFLKHLIEGEYPANINIYVLYTVYLINTVLSYFLFAYRTSLLNAYQRYDIISIVSGCTSVILYMLEIIVIITTKNYYLYSGCTVLCTILNNILIMLSSKRLIPEIKCCGQVGKEIVDDVKSRVKALLGHRIGTAVITSADNIVISSFLGLVAVAFYNNYYYVITAMIGFIDVVQASATASIGNSLVTESRSRNHELFMTINFITLWIVGWGTICYITIIQDFITVWIGNKYLYTSFGTIILLGVYFYTWKIRSVIQRFKEAAGMWNADFWKPYVSAITNIVINIILVQKIGVNGVLLSTIITMVFINLPWEAHVLYKYLFLENSNSFYLSLLQNLLFTICVGSLTYYICSHVNLSPLSSLLIKLSICIVFPNFIFLLVYRKNKYFKKSLFVLRN